MYQMPTLFPEFNRVRAERAAYQEAYGENNDCSVIALSIAVGIPYDVAHRMLTDAGRRKGHGFAMTTMLRDYARTGRTLCGYKFTQVDCSTLDVSATRHYSRAMFTGVYKYKTVAQIRRDFPKGRFMVSIHKHIFAMIDGDILDYTGTRARVKYLTYVERA